jgi:4-hydroxy-3-methylbut-2-enyl diphosphate reductase
MRKLMGAAVETRNEGSVRVKINLAKTGGFCFGVRRAIAIALATAKSGAKVEMLGDIVHNEDVVGQMNDAGIRTIKRLGRGKNKILLIRAHGASQEVFDNALQRGYTIVDATCPKVRKIYKLAELSKREGCEVIIIGDKNHDEVRGIVGQLKGKALVIDSPKRMPIKQMQRISKACVVVQSTQNLDTTLDILARLKKHIKALNFYNTICKPTRIKQQEIKTLPQRNDAMIIIGSRTSANTRRLFEIARSLNKRTHWIQSKHELKAGWFRGAQSVGVMAGASTPDETTRDVIDRIRSF